MTKTTILALLCLFGFARGASAEFLARISLVPTDLGGTPITSISPGEDFLLQAIVQDVRNPPPELASGVFAAYLNATFDPGLVSFATAAVLNFDPYFELLQVGDLSTPGLVSGAGAGAISVPPGNAAQLLWNVQLTATAPGVVSFTPSFDSLPGHDVLLILKNDALLESEIEFGPLQTLTIVPEPSALILAVTAIVGLAAFGCRRRKR